MIERIDTERRSKAPVEIERKFKVDISKIDELGPLDRYEHNTVRQGYLVLGSDGSEARIRDSDGVYTATIKKKGDLARKEWETQLTKEQFDDLWAASEGQRVEKVRFRIPHGEYTVELDVYIGDLEGLVTAEIEFPDIRSAQDFVAPDWLGVDVTKDARYKNQNLAQGGIDD